MRFGHYVRIMGFRATGESPGGFVCRTDEGPNRSLAEAYADLLVERGDELRAYVYRLTGDEALADDVLQEVSLVVLRASPSQEDIVDLMAWAKGVARYKVIRMKKCQAREVCTEQFEGTAEEAVPDSERQVASRELLDRVLPGLRDSSADLLLRRHILGENASEIADRSGRSAAAVRMKLKRVLSLARLALFER